jgi:hypothetical protein
MSLIGPTLPTWTLQQVGSYPGYTGRDANVVAKAAFDPTLPTWALVIWANLQWCQRRREDSL